LGIGDWAQSPIPNPQSPIPNPQSPFKIFLILNKETINLLKQHKFYLIKLYKLLNKNV
jgi:hypothetical protein